MKRTTLIALGMLVSATAFAQDLSRGDKDFLEKAAHAGHTEIEGSRLAQQKATHPEVKSFAEQMIKDHTAAGEELSKLAQSKGVKLPAEPAVMDKAKLKALSAMDGANFDKRYANQIGVAAHKDTVQLFEKASKDAKDADVKAFATKTLPKLQHHLQMAETLQATVDKSNANKSDANKSDASKPAAKGDVKK